MTNDNLPARRDEAPSEPPATRAPNTIQLGTKNVVDLSGMTEQQQQSLRQKHAELEIERDHRTQGLAVDAQVLGRTLETLSTNVTEANERGVSVTVTNTRDDHLGRTEVRMGNTAADREGKFTRSQTGQDDSKVWIIALAIVGVVIILVVLASR